MVDRSTAVAAAAGALGGALLVAATQSSITGLAFGNLLSPMPLAMVALSLGPAYLPVAIMGGALTASLLSGTFALAAVYLLADAAPIVALLRLARRPPGDKAVIGQSVAALAVAGMGLMVLALAAIPTNAEGVEAAIKAQLDARLSAAAQAGMIDAQQATDMVAAVAALIPGAAAADWCLRCIVSATLAQAVLVRIGEAQSATPAYRMTVLPSWYIAVFWATAATAWAAIGDVKYVAMNGAAVLCLPLLMQGLAVVHSGIARMDQGRAALVVFYVTAILTSGLSFMMLVTLGVVEHFLKLRVRMATPQQGG